MEAILENELRIYEEHRDDLLATSENKFVLIRGDHVQGTYESDRDAVDAGYEAFGNVPFLVKRVLRVERPVTYVSSFFAIQ